MPDTWTNCNSILFDLIYLPLQRDGSSISLCMSHAILSSDGARCLISNQLKSVPYNLFLHTHLPRLPQCQQFLDIFTLGFASWLRPAHTKEKKTATLQLQTTWILSHSPAPNAQRGNRGKTKLLFANLLNWKPTCFIQTTFKRFQIIDVLNIKVNVRNPHLDSFIMTG